MDRGQTVNLKAETRIDGDAPTERDELGRAPYVDALARIVRTADTPIVLAVYGSWGSGKTSLMMQLRRQIDQAFDHEGISASAMKTVWFDPWMHQFDDTPALGLLHAAADQLGVSRDRAVVDALSRIAVALGEDIQLPFVGVRVGKLLKIREELAKDDFRRREEQARFRSHFHQVLRQFGAADQRVIFFIDDLDRCQPQVALSLLEALKLYLDLPGCVFVLGVDREPLEAAVAAQYQTLGLRKESYLDKIIQLPFSIPAISEQAMDAFVAARLPADLQMCAALLAAASADEPRNVKRLANSLQINHELASTAVFANGYDPTILALVVLIQNRAPSLYQQLRLDPSLIHELFRARSEEDARIAGRHVQPDAEPQTSLWDLYVAGSPRLERALGLVVLSEDVDLTPYITLTSITTMTEGATDRASSAGRVFVSYRRSDARTWAPRISGSLRDLGWEVLEDVGLRPGDDFQRESDRAIESSDAMVLLIGQGFLDRDSEGRVRVAVTDDYVNTELRRANEVGIPVIPILVDFAEMPNADDLPPEIGYITRRNALQLDNDSYSVRMAELDLALRSITSSAKS